MKIGGKGWSKKQGEGQRYDPTQLSEETVTSQYSQSAGVLSTGNIKVLYRFIAPTA